VGGILALQAAVALWLLHSASLTSVATTRSVLGPAAAIAGAGVTVFLSSRVARLEGLLPVRPASCGWCIARPGAALELSGPFGAFVLPEILPARLLFRTAGSGITPVMACCAR
jgi:hypothetical protein